MSLPIAQLGQPVLREIAAPVSAEAIALPEFQELLLEMLETLRKEKGAGLAAPQVFVSERVFLAMIEPPIEDDDSPAIEVFVNPTIKPIGDEMVTGWEGCLSFPELLVLVPRHRAVVIEYLNAQGEPMAKELHDFPARVVQHEFDHLEGILTIDRAESPLHIVKASEIEAVREAMGD